MMSHDISYINNSDDTEVFLWLTLVVSRGRVVMDTKEKKETRYEVLTEVLM